MSARLLQDFDIATNLGDVVSNTTLLALEATTNHIAY